MSDVPLGGDQIRAYLLEVAELLPVGAPQCIVVVGGSLLALLGFRKATSDVDSVTRLEATLRSAVAEVARRHDLGSQWVNDSAAGFLPQTLKEEECTVLLDHPRLQVLGAPLRQIFVMKLFASRALDVADLAAIWNEYGFDSPEQAAALYQAAYPTSNPTSTWSTRSGSSPAARRVRTGRGVRPEGRCSRTSDTRWRARDPPAPPGHMHTKGSQGDGGRPEGRTGSARGRRRPTATGRETGGPATGRG